MKIENILCIALTGLLVGAGLSAAVAGDKMDKEARLVAKVSKADAEKIALAKVPNGTVKEGELEKEDGKIVWSFDISTPDTKDITEVQVDANTGEVVSVEKETSRDEAREKKGKKDGDDNDNDKDEKK